ncbi:S1 family peptidase [Gordonia effusa]|uniref:S1 family peptidase n=1 Tax=Gordonia effusa TaxID=263908 RepID=UPI001FE0A27F|nr:S1 family peptidase [Gordonia effusa]
MSRTRLGAAAAGIAAAVVMSACSTGVAGQPVAPTGNPSATAAAESTGPSTDVETTWSTIPDAEAAAAPKRITLTQSATGAPCTAGPAVAAAAAAGHRGYLTAGHCDQVRGSSVTAGGHAVAPYTGTIAGEYGATVTWGASSASPTVAGRNVVGVLTREATQKLDYHTAVCVDAAVSGVQCGLLVDADGDGIGAKVSTVPGDSGSPLFLVGPRGITLIGLVEESAEPYTYAAYLDPLLAQMGAKALVDRSAAVDPRTDPRYSTATTSQ